MNLHDLSLEEKVGQLLMVGFDGLSAPPYILEWLASGQLGGIILFSRNVGSPQQLAALNHSLRQAAKYPIFIAIDQEGGAVSRLRGGYTESPGAMALGAADSETLAESVAAIMGRELRAVGINWNLAPVADMTRNINNPSVGTRSLGDDPQRVGRLAAAQGRGFAQAGVIASAKHFPGLGNTPIDSHDDLPMIEDSVAELQQGDLIPFKMMIEDGIASIMITHVNFPKVDPVYPSTMSHAIITGLLRQELGFKGLICTDCMEMSAITRYHSAAESGLRSAQAGSDVILFSHTEARQKEAFQAMVAAAHAGDLSTERLEDALQRIIPLKAQHEISESRPAEIRQPAHLALAQEAARAGLTLLNAAQLPPLTGGALLVEFSPNLDSMAMDATGLHDLAGILAQRWPTLTAIILNPAHLEADLMAQAQQQVQYAEQVIIATRNAHLLPGQLEAAQQLLALRADAVLVCLRNPFDAQRLSAAAILCSCGDSTPSLEAVADALTGQFQPSGRLPVRLG
jgi:beta-N-acetylhexosaminidase